MLCVGDSLDVYMGMRQSGLGLCWQMLLPKQSLSRPEALAQAHKGRCLTLVSELIRLDREDFGSHRRLLLWMVSQKNGG